MATTTATQDVNRLAEVCVGSAPSETLAGRFHQAMRVPYDAQSWARLAALAEEIAEAARRVEQHVTR